MENVNGLHAGWLSSQAKHERKPPTRPWEIIFGEELDFWFFLFVTILNSFHSLCFSCSAWAYGPPAEAGGVGSGVRTEALFIISAPPAPLNVLRFLFFGFLFFMFKCGSHICRTFKGGCLVQGGVSVISFGTIGGILLFSWFHNHHFGRLWREDWGGNSALSTVLCLRVFV